MKHLIGRQVKILHRALLKDNTYHTVGTESGTVTDVYKYHFRVRIGNHYECFRYHEITGNEHTKVLVKGE